MTRREQKSCKGILDALHDMDGAQADDRIIHAEAQLVIGDNIPLAEFNAALALCDARRWITGVKSKFAGTKYSINDRGEAARLEMTKA